MRRLACLVLCLLPLAGIADARPNILLLVAEDLSPRIGVWGDAVAQTPNLDALAHESVRYARVFTTAGVCAPSRAALMTGQHQISFGGQHMRTSTGPLGEYYARPSVRAFPELLRAAGYFTFTDFKLDYQFSGTTAGSGPFSIWDAEGMQAHWRQRAPEQPFFGVINFMETHESGVMRLDVDPYNAKHGGSQQMRRQFGLVADPITNPAELELAPYYPDLPEVREDIARHYDNIHAMDARVGAVLAALEADGIREETIVIWTSDHGDGLPRAKRDLYDAGIHVPMLIDIPEAYRPLGWQPGGVDARLVSFVDLAPTILQWAGVEAPDALHGRNLLHSEREYVYASRDRIDEVMDRQRAVRDERYKYVRSWYPDVPGGHALEYRDGLAMMRAMRAAFEAATLDAAQAAWFLPPGEERLYDLAADPHELVNRIDDPNLQAVRARLRNALIDWLVRVGDTGILPESELRASLLIDGEVPVTPPPRARTVGEMLVVEADAGASVGWRADDGPWRLYTGPVEVTGSVVEVKAVRYGMRESEVVRLEAPND